MYLIVVSPIMLMMGKHFAKTINKGFSILFVDNEVEQTKILAEKIKEQGFTPFIARNLSEAKAHLKSKKINAIISDLKLPDGYGSELIEIAQACEPKIPIIFVSGYPGGIEFNKLSTHEMLLYKPVNFKVLHQLLEKMQFDSIHDDNPYLQPVNPSTYSSQKSFAVKTYLLTKNSNKKCLVELICNDEDEILIEAPVGLLHANEDATLEMETFNASENIKCTMKCTIIGIEELEKDTEMLTLRLNSTQTSEELEMISRFYMIVSRQQEFVMDFFRTVRA